MLLDQFGNMIISLGVKDSSEILQIARHGVEGVVHGLC